MTAAKPDRDPLTSWVLVVVLGAGIVLLALGSTGTLRWKVVAGAVQVLGLLLAAVGVGVINTELQRVITTARGVTDTARHQLMLRRHALRAWWARRRGLPPPTIRVSRSFQLSYDIHDDLVRHRPAAGQRDQATLLAALDADLDKAFARVNETKASIAVTRNELLGEIVRVTRQGWELVVAGLICSAVGTTIGIWA